MDGFTTLAVSELEEGSALNVEPYRNEYSPFSRVQAKAPASASAEVLVDTYYGLAYDSWVHFGGAAYGITDALPIGPLDDIARGFLRIPFARIPCIDVEDGAALLTTMARVRDANPGLTLLFRGQNCEYLLNRGAETLHALYGGDVREPSLLPSAERRVANIDDVGPAWCGLLRHTLDLWATARKDDAAFRRFESAGRHYLFHRFALAMAQHYGLPSSGLDVTSVLDVALFFALHSFAGVPGQTEWVQCSRLRENASRPVLYVLAVETDQQYFSFEEHMLGSCPN